MPDIADAISEASRCWPSPVVFLWLSAARIAIVVCRPAITSKVVTGQVFAATAAEPADRRVDDRRVHGAYRVVIEAEPGKAARLEVLHEHVRAAGKLLREHAVAVVLEVERDRSLVPVDREEVRRDAVLGDRRHP
jgi:hypothetical protein